MDVDLYRWKDVADPSALPDRPTLLAWAATTREDLKKLLAAPVGEPYAGPVLLRGRAAGVFVHEVIGHRVEGHRQKKEDEGRTFRELVGDRVLPPEISIVDDPTLASYGGFDLNGHYAYDDQGIPAARATIAGEGEPVISSTGMASPASRSRSTSTRPVISGICWSRMRQAGSGGVASRKCVADG